MTGESLSYMQASVGVLHQWVPDGRDTPYSASLTYRHAWAGGQPYRSEINATLGTQFTFENSDVLSISGGARFTHSLTNGSDVATYSLRGRWARGLDNGDIIGATAQLAKAQSDATRGARLPGMMQHNHDELSQSLLWDSVDGVMTAFRDAVPRVRDS